MIFTSLLYVGFDRINHNNLIFKAMKNHHARHWATNFWSCLFYFDFLVFLDVFGALSPKMTLVFS